MPTTARAEMLSKLDDFDFGGAGRPTGGVGDPAVG